MNNSSNPLEIVVCGNAETLGILDDDQLPMLHEIG